MGRLENKVAVITGGNSGIGKATAQRFVEEGAKVVIFGRNLDTLNQAAAEIGANCLPVQGDVTDAHDLKNLYQSVLNQYGKINVLFANAGVAPFVPLEQVDEQHFDQVMNINVKGVYFTVKHALTAMADGASVILNSSIVNATGYPNLSVYSASKAAVRSFARTFSAELASRKIRVNVISPGATETPLFAHTGLTPEELQGFAQSISSQVPLRRFGSPHEIAEAVVFMASDESSYMVGAEMVVDGGLTQV